MQGSSNNNRKIEESLRSELKAAQGVLTLQQQDNYQYQDHIKILNGEIDALRIMLEDKQVVINSLKNTVVTKDDRIAELEALLHENRIERHAFKTFEHQNVLLLEELKDTKNKMEELEVEVRFLRELKDDRITYDEEKIKMVAEMEIMLNGQNYSYNYK